MTDPVPSPVDSFTSPVPVDRRRSSREAQELIVQLREALAAAQATNRALEIGAERVRQEVRALRAAIAPSELPPGREASLLLQVADLTRTVGDWQARYGRCERDRQSAAVEADRLSLVVDSQAATIAGLQERVESYQSAAAVFRCFRA